MTGGGQRFPCQIGHFPGNTALPLGNTVSSPGNTVSSRGVALLSQRAMLSLRSLARNKRHSGKLWRL